MKFLAQEYFLPGFPEKAAQAICTILEALDFYLPLFEFLPYPSWSDFPILNFEKARFFPLLKVNPEMLQWH